MDNREPPISVCSARNRTSEILDHWAVLESEAANAKRTVIQSGAFSNDLGNDPGFSVFSLQVTIGFVISNETTGFGVKVQRPVTHTIGNVRQVA